MLSAYRQVFAVPGARAFTAAGLALRAPLAMYPVALVLLTSLHTGRYALGGVLTAAYTVGGGIGAPLLSRAADRGGQRRVLLVAAGAHAAAIGALVLAVRADAPTLVWVFAAAANGLFFVPVGAFIRARWVFLLRDSPDRLDAAMSAESVFDETTYVVGPVITAGLAAGVGPLAPFAIIAVMVVGGAVPLGLMGSTMPPVQATRSGEGGRLPVGIMVLCVALMTVVGVTLGWIDLAAIAFTGQAGHVGWTGAVLACFAAASGTAGFLYGVRAWRVPVVRRLAATSLVFAVLPLALLLARNVLQLAVLMAVVGVGTAPMIITVFGTIERVVPLERLTEAMGWTVTGLEFGAGIAAPVIGWLADDYGARTALLAPAAAAVVAGALGVLTARQARPLDREAVGPA